MSSWSRPDYPPLPRQRGVALITALLVVALASIAAVAMLSAQNIAIQRTANIISDEQAWWYALGLEQWARTLLQRDRQNSKIDSLAEAWAHQVDFLPIDNGYLKGGMIDLQGRFNLNNLSGNSPQAAMQMFSRLLESLPDIDPTQAPALVQAVRDWIDPDINPQNPDGAEDGYYLGLNPAYRTPNRFMDSVSELLAIRGFTPKIYLALRPYVTALPATGTPINVNTAPLPVLMALAPNLDAASMKSLVDSRASAPFPSVQAFLSAPALAGQSVNSGILSVSSQYFLAHGLVHLGSTQLIIYSLLYRDAQGKTYALEHAKGGL